MIRYWIGHSGQVLTFSAAAVAKFSYHRQTRWYHREAGGQLFARFSGNEVVVEVATGPRWRDRRTRHTYEPHRPSEQREIDRHHRYGLHFVGDWHTHAEKMPRPSALDLESMAESFARSTHRLNAFVMVIVGTEPPPDGMSVFVCNANAAYELSVSDRKAVALPDLISRTDPADARPPEKVLSAGPIVRASAPLL